MLHSKEKIELKLNNVTMEVTALDLPKYTAFRIVFSSSRPPLVVARTKDADKNTWWTSIPEGRQKEAEGVGKLIDDYFQNKDN